MQIIKYKIEFKYTRKEEIEVWDGDCHRIVKDCWQNWSFLIIILVLSTQTMKKV